MHENDKDLINKELRNSPDKPLQTSLQKDSENDPQNTPELTPELQRVVKVWPGLPEHIKEAIAALVKPFSGGSE